MQSLPLSSLISLITLCLTSLLGLVQAAWVSNTIRNSYRYSPISSTSTHPPCWTTRTSLSATVQNDKDIDPPIPLWTDNDVDEFANDRGLVISFSTLGPGYRAVARAKHDESMILGYVEGFIRPAGKILHLDKMQVFQPMAQRVKRQIPNSLDFGGVSFGLGLLLGYTCLMYGKENGCQMAEFLAIDDESFQHKRLVRYYKRVGFRVVKYVGDGITDIPDRLVWGGCGTLMEEEIDVLMRKWANLMELMKSRTQPQ